MENKNISKAYSETQKTVTKCIEDAKTNLNKLLSMEIDKFNISNNDLSDFVKENYEKGYHKEILKIPFQVGQYNKSEISWLRLWVCRCCLKKGDYQKLGREVSQLHTFINFSDIIFLTQFCELEKIEKTISKQFTFVDQLLHEFNNIQMEYVVSYYLAYLALLLAFDRANESMRRITEHLRYNGNKYLSLSYVESYILLWNALEVEGYSLEEHRYELIISMPDAECLKKFTFQINETFATHRICFHLTDKVKMYFFKRRNFDECFDVINNFIQNREQNCFYELDISEQNLFNFTYITCLLHTNNEEKIKKHSDLALSLAKKGDDKQLFRFYFRKILQFNIPTPSLKENKFIEYQASEEEAKLARSLQWYCNEYGKETWESLAYTAEIFKNLGEFYQNKSRHETRKEQRLSLIRSCALLNGARVRFKKLLKKMASHEEMYNKLKEMLKVTETRLKDVGDLAQITSNDSSKSVNLRQVDLFQTAVTIFKQYVNVFRNNARKMIQNIVKDKEKIGCRDLEIQSEQTKIYSVKELTNNVCKGFLQTMQEISKTCTNILGPAPCEYCLVGLGSLARKEITPYSDFEHVIVLEQSIDKSEHYEDYLEYFRSFTMIFQTIILNFGETFIRSVGVRSINDLNNPDRSKNWFFDDFTPVGIAFDGMVRHASMNPLGAQEPSAFKSHVVELIKPVKEMAKYLTMEEHVKNGYYLREILARICFVSGSQIVYNIFKKEVMESVQNIAYENYESTIDALPYVDKDEYKKVDMLPSQIKLITKNVVHSVAHFLYSEKFISIKRDLYRPAVTHIAVLARIHGIPNPISFQVIDELEKRKILNSNFSHNLRYLLAVVCELRMRSYIETGSERGDRVTYDKILSWLGKSSTLKMFLFLRFLVRNSVNLAFLSKETIEMKFDPFEKIFAMLRCEMFDEVITEVTPYMTKNLRLQSLGDLAVWRKLEIAYTCIHYVRASLNKLTNNVENGGKIILNDYENLFKYMVIAMLCSQSTYKEIGCAWETVTNLEHRLIFHVFTIFDTAADNRYEILHYWLKELQEESKEYKIYKFFRHIVNAKISSRDGDHQKSIKYYENALGMISGEDKIKAHIHFQKIFETIIIGKYKEINYDCIEKNIAEDVYSEPIVKAFIYTKSHLTGKTADRLLLYLKYEINNFDPRQCHKYVSWISILLETCRKITTAKKESLIRKFNTQLVEYTFNPIFPSLAKLLGNIGKVLGESQVLIDYSDSLYSLMVIQIYCGCYSDAQKTYKKFVPEIFKSNKEKELKFIIKQELGKLEGLDSGTITSDLNRLYTDFDTTQTVHNLTILYQFMRHLIGNDKNDVYKVRKILFFGVCLVNRLHEYDENFKVKKFAFYEQIIGILCANVIKQPMLILLYWEFFIKVVGETLYYLLENGKIGQAWAMSNQCIETLKYLKYSHAA